MLKLEKNRLPNKAWKIKRISDFDVSAGYDIVSFKEADSVTYDRYVEVKCYLGQPHFYWSENESEVAMIKGDKYVLCLVDYSRINEPGYIPEYINNPYSVIEYSVTSEPLNPLHRATHSECRSHPYEKVNPLLRATS